MKRGVVFAVFAAMSAATLMATDSRPGIISRAEAEKRLRKLTPEEQKQRIEAGRLAAEKRLGGFLCAPVTGKVIRVINRQNALVAEDVEKIVHDTCGTLNYIAEIVAVDPSDGRTGARIELVEDDSPTLLVAPEDFWSRVNVLRLTVDKPDVKLLRRRFIKEFWRAFAMALGAANSNYQPCLMRTVSSLDDLDGDDTLTPCPEPFDKIQRTGEKIGLVHPRRVSYKRACQEGWAPAPTNDVQKAIWEQVHSLPTEPIKIKPETKKVSN